MHQHQVGSMRLQRLEAGANGSLARCTARHRREQGEPIGRRPEQIGVVGMNDRLDRGNFRMARQPGEAQPDQRFAQHRTVLLGHVAARAQSAAGCHDDSCDHGCHVLPLQARLRKSNCAGKSRQH
jgi:hypothetical protein